MVDVKKEVNQAMARKCKLFGRWAGALTKHIKGGRTKEEWEKSCMEDYVNKIIKW